MRKHIENAKPVPRFLYTVEDEASSIYTAHKDANEARSIGEDMMQWTQDEGIPTQFYMQRHTLH